jgi:large subunit ribosomal protein L23
LILEGKRQYIFEVSSSASKPQIKKDIENLYVVKVESVNIINNKRRARFIRGKAGFNPGFKKAIIKLQEGHKIEIAPH